MEFTLSKLYVEADRVANLALPYLEASNMTYYLRFFDVVRSAYIVQSIPRRAHLVPYNPHDRLGSYNEEDGDVCFVQLTGNDICRYVAKEPSFSL